MTKRQSAEFQGEVLIPSRHIEKYIYNDDGDKTMPLCGCNQVIYSM